MKEEKTIDALRYENLFWFKYNLLKLNDAKYKKKEED